MEAYASLFDPFPLWPIEKVLAFDLSLTKFLLQFDYAGSRRSLVQP